MIPITRSYPAPECLQQEKLKTNGTHRCNGVLMQLQQDFFNKCYLCEMKGITSINIEHFKSADNNSTLKLEWGNLFFVCGHCNQIKSNQFDDILDCTCSEYQVDKLIELSMDAMPYAQVNIKEKLHNQQEIAHKTLKSCELLDKIYNGTGSENKALGSKNLRQAILREINAFVTDLSNYQSDESEADEKNKALRGIKKHLQATSAFTAFKRWLVWNNPDCKQQFGHLIRYKNTP